LFFFLIYRKESKVLKNKTLCNIKSRLALFFLTPPPPKKIPEQVQILKQQIILCTTEILLRNWKRTSNQLQGICRQNPPPN